MIEIIWLGQAGFSITTDGMRVLVDPFMSEHELRLAGPPPLDDVAVDVDWLLVTHEHLDHLDLGFLPVLLERSPQAQVVLPAPLVELAEPLAGRQRLHPVTPGDQFQLSSTATLAVMPAWHGVEIGDGYSDGSEISGQPRFVGYILSTGDVSIYHSGDTLVKSELLHELSSRAVDVALLPINGRDYFREEAGLVGNMGVREAVQLAVRTGIRTLVPMHWDLFAGNTERPGAVLDEVVATGGDIHVLTLARFKPYRLA